MTDIKFKAKFEHFVKVLVETKPDVGWPKVGTALSPDLDNGAILFGDKKLVTIVEMGACRHWKQRMILVDNVGSVDWFPLPAAIKRLLGNFGDVVTFEYINFDGGVLIKLPDEAVLFYTTTSPEIIRLIIHVAESKLKTMESLDVMVDILADCFETLHVKH